MRPAIVKAGVVTSLVAGSVVAIIYALPQTSDEPRSAKQASKTSAP